ncbi:MAG: hypothetical protein NTW29_15470 [Bacteroidetes bacterium]|nr:hypothetical protein [Bacteroidota bacterium]
MKHSTTIAVVTAIVVTVAFFACDSGKQKTKTTNLRSTPGTLFPANVMQSCPMNPDSFNTWFASGKASENGAVNHANSLTFVHDSNCNFYRWSQQMFLWVTSPMGKGSVMESPLFFTVTPPDSAGNRDLIPHTPGQPLRATGHIEQSGPHRLPIMNAKDGRRFEIVKAIPGKPVMVLNEKGQQVEVSSVDRTNAAMPQLMDKSGKPIAKAKALLGKLKDNPMVVQEIIKDGKPVYIDANGNVVESEAGQATGDVLRAQNGSLVYYITMVNDVYAWFLAGVQNNQYSGYQFPTTAAKLDSICAYARANGAVLPDSTALAMELKTSWVEASSLPDASAYFTIEAVIPTYDTSSNTSWTVKGERTTKLALVGIHIIGSMNEHPEMVWSTLEHVNNTPNAAYSYVDATNAIQRVNQDGGSSWLFSNNGADPSPNISHMSNSGENILANTGYTISASNTLRTKPFGVADSNYQPNSQVANAAASNSQVISLNNDIYGLLVGGDIRKNYFLVGSTWTSGGNGPDGTSYLNSSSSPGTAIGTSQLANSTMETYAQNGTSYNLYGSCFACHNGGGSLAPGALSHVYSDIVKLNFLKLSNKK